MCGITGVVSYKSINYKDVLMHMNDALIHRGPDSFGITDWCNADTYIGFGHRRLSIIDLSATGHQPMMTEDNNFAITLNGEIYNYKEIRRELESLGCKFQSKSDTEVVLHAFMQWGVKSVHKFIGMFAFAIYDKNDNSIYLFRDRAGVKPLYYYTSDNIFLFASELKSFHSHPEFKKNVNHDVVSDFLRHGFIPSPHTIYENCYKLKPGHYIRIDLKNKTFNEIEYWNVLDYYNRMPVILPETELLDHIEDLLKSSFNYRMVADVPVGIFLSGGYDSSLVAALLQSDAANKINTFTIGFEEDAHNEAPFAKNIAKHLGTNHQEVYCSSKQALDLIVSLPEVYDEPFGDSSALPTMLVSKMAAQNVKVALSADGGDELFCGYPWYTQGMRIYDKFARLDGNNEKLLSFLLSILNNPVTRATFSPLLLQKILKFQKVLNTKNFNEKYRYKTEPYHFKEFELDSLLLNKANKISSNFDEFKFLTNSSDPINMLMAIDFKTIMVDDYLVKVDRASMAYSLECREPFLDHRLAEFMATVPSDIKRKNNIDKYILKTITHKYIPAGLMVRPKMGFAIPERQWLKNELKETVMDTLSSADTRAFFNSKTLSNLLSSFYKSERVDETNIWYLLMFQMWYSKWK